MAKNKIEFEQISENEIEVVIPPETPMEMVAQLTKGFVARGLVENLAKSTLSVRYFYRPESVASGIADKLIKSLKGLAKEEDEELPYWHPKAKMANQKRVREQEIADRRGQNQTQQPSNVSTSTASRMYDHTPAATNTADGTGKRYAYIRDPIAKDEDDVEKSGYGPKGSGQYSVADNIRRKANNTGDQTGFGANTNTKQYTTAKFGNKSPQSTAAQKRPGPVKTMKDMSPEEIAEMQAKYNKQPMKKAWGQHLPFPSAEEEIMNLAKATVQDGETAAANQLARLMAGKSMLNNAPPPQPTDEQMFGHMVVSEEMEKANNEKWQGAAFDWLKEAQKPISQKFASEADEIAYWNNIKVSDRDDGQSGY